MSDWNTVAILKVMPESVDADLTAIQDAIRALVGDDAEIHSMQEKPIAFGLKALEVALLMNDQAGKIEDIQAKIADVSGVGEIEVADVNRL